MNYDFYVHGTLNAFNNVLNYETGEYAITKTEENKV